MNDEIKLCKDCTFFIHSGEQCGNSRMTPDYVFGKPAKTRDAQIERLNSNGCGPEAKNFVKIVPADYADTMIRRDREARHIGRPEHDLDIVGRALKAGM